MLIVFQGINIYCTHVESQQTSTNIYDNPERKHRQGSARAVSQLICLQKIDLVGLLQFLSPASLSRSQYCGSYRQLSSHLSNRQLHKLRNEWSGRKGNFIHRGQTPTQPSHVLDDLGYKLGSSIPLMLLLNWGALKCEVPRGQVQIASIQAFSTNSNSNYMLRYAIW